MPVQQLRNMVYASLMAALIAVGAYIHIPFGPVPIVLQNLFVLLAGLLLGCRWGAISTAIYLLVGAVGFPVFAGATGGLAHLLGPTGGYLFGFVGAAFLTGYIAEQFKQHLAAQIAAVAVGSILIYIVGVPWLKFIAGLSWSKAFVVGMLPFLPGDIIKASAAVLLAKALRPMITHQFEPASS